MSHIKALLSLFGGLGSVMAPQWLQVPEMTDMQVQLVGVVATAIIVWLIPNLKITAINTRRK